MKTILTILTIVLLASCAKEYSGEVTASNVIEVSLIGTPYVATVNGSTRNYWKLDIALGKKLDTDIRVILQFDDSDLSGMTISMPFSATSQQSTFYSQYPASGSLKNIKLIRVDGSSLTFKLK